MPTFVGRTAALAAVLFLSSACSGGAGRSPAVVAPRILLNRGPSGSSVVEVVGLPTVLLSHLEQNPPSRDQWTALLRVTVAGEAGQASDRPAMLGAYSIEHGALRFRPQFAFDP